MRRLLAALSLGLVLVGVGVAATSPPQLGGCPVFPASNAWNRDVSHDPVDPHSAAWIASISGNLHADFGSPREYGIPFTTVPTRQRRVPIRFTAYGDESDPGPYPI